MGLEYKAESTTVWQLGCVLFEMLHPNCDFTTERFLKQQIAVREDLSLGR